MYSPPPPVIWCSLAILKYKQSDSFPSKQPLQQLLLEQFGTCKVFIKLFWFSLDLINAFSLVQVFSPAVTLDK